MVSEVGRTGKIRFLFHHVLLQSKSLPEFTTVKDLCRLALTFADIFFFSMHFI